MNDTRLNQSTPIATIKKGFLKMFSPEGLSSISMKRQILQKIKKMVSIRNTFSGKIFNPCQKKVLIIENKTNVVLKRKIAVLIF
jgi:hypothetical protein